MIVYHYTWLTALSLHVLEGSQILYLQMYTKQAPLGLASLLPLSPVCADGAPLEWSAVEADFPWWAECRTQAGAAWAFIMPEVRVSVHCFLPVAQPLVLVNDMTVAVWICGQADHTALSCLLDLPHACPSSPVSHCVGLSDAAH